MSQEYTPLKERIPDDVQHLRDHDREVLLNIISDYKDFIRDDFDY